MPSSFLKWNWIWIRIALLRSVNCQFSKGSFSVAQTVKVYLQCGRLGFNPLVGKISWRRKWQRTPVFLPGKSHGQRSVVGYSPWGRKEWTQLSNFTHSLTHSLILGSGMATYSGILTWRILETEEPGRLQSLGSRRAGHEWATITFTFTSG